eukprot:TRINITY_DN25873_c0_g1_i1.p1 TRINITY_DN25873_c0_g1~~TRINITY_DN25873_c0_g1_i1.p1  ORF type:complete len:125 (+),score=34.06 TRINITY_DN25873_c0_g1_i1:118-492(+)
MLSRGFTDQIYDVFRKLPENVQVGLFSATMPDEVLEMTGIFFQAEDGIRDLVRSRGLGDVYKRQDDPPSPNSALPPRVRHDALPVSYTHLTLPTSYSVERSWVRLERKKNTGRTQREAVYTRRG